MPRLTLKTRNSDVINRRWQRKELDLVDQEVVLYTRNYKGELDADSFKTGIVHGLRFTMQGDKLVIIEHQIGTYTRHRELFFLDTRKRYSSWNYPYWFFCLPEEELPAEDTTFCHAVV